MSEIISNAGTTLAFPEEKEKMLFLYNVQTKKFLNVGGYWGTHVSLQEYGKPFWAVKKNYHRFLEPTILILLCTSPRT